MDRKWWIENTVKPAIEGLVDGLVVSLALIGAMTMGVLWWITAR